MSDLMELLSFFIERDWRPQALHSRLIGLLFFSVARDWRIVALHSRLIELPTFLRGARVAFPRASLAAQPAR
jgi:hypothetical protein